MANILFLHGLESRPGGSKAKHLENLGHTVYNPAIPKWSFEESISIAQKVIDDNPVDVIVGSSRGGAVAMCVNPGSAKVVLIAPAWSHFKPSENQDIDESTMILHSRKDDIVKIQDSRKLVENFGATLIEVGDDHRMNDSSALEALQEAVEWSITH